jgi:hypothetical protein
MVTMLAPVLLAVLGALVFGLMEGKPSELGRLCFAAGVFAIAFMLAREHVHLF